MKYCLWLFIIFHATTVQAKIGYVGSENCQSCHSNETTLWQSSDHAKAMQDATATTVLGNFNNITVNFNDISSLFYQRDGKFFVKTQGLNETAQDFLIKYTFGHYPLQQYLIELEDGFIQAFNIAWDSRPKAEGGQRWFHLRPGEKNWTAEQPFYWTNHFQNWNSRCAECHSTNVTKNYNAKQHQFDTHWSEINVACEACHGPASKHVELAQNGSLSSTQTGFKTPSSTNKQWAFKQGESIAQFKGDKTQTEIDMCGSCHSLRTNLNTDTSPNQSYHNKHAIQLIQPPNYFVDGQIHDEVFVLGSFLQSKMYQQGVTCTNCHNPHSGKLIKEGNSLCTQCHQASNYDSSQHHHHKNNQPGSLCVNCHMPSRTYMGVDDRRDHKFSIPSVTAKELGAPLACDNCHQQNSPTATNWASKKLASWPKNNKSLQDLWTNTNDQLLRNSQFSTEELSQIFLQTDLNNIAQASLLTKLANSPSRETVALAHNKLSHSSPLVRSAAIQSLQALPMRVKWQLLAPLLNEQVASVRFRLAEVLMDGWHKIAMEDQNKLTKLLDEYRVMLEASSESPSSQAAIAVLETHLGRPDLAQQAYLRAMNIDPTYTPVLLNLADLYNQLGEASKAPPLLEKALKIAPDSGAAQYSYGLYLVRNKNYPDALKHFRLATETSNATSRFAYVYAVALDHQAQTRESIEVLIAATDRWPNQADLLMLLIQYLEKEQRSQDVKPYLLKLAAIAPQNPSVQQLLQKYR